jgi:hypothetical protein
LKFEEFPGQIFFAEKNLTGRCVRTVPTLIGSRQGRSQIFQSDLNFCARHVALLFQVGWFSGVLLTLWVASRKTFYVN